MKKIIAILLVLILASAFAFAGCEEYKGLSIGADIALFQQGVSLRYDFGRWAEVEGNFSLPVVVQVAELIENGGDIDYKAILSPMMRVKGYATPLSFGCFTLGLGAYGEASFLSGGPWVQDAGKESETLHDGGSIGMFFVGAVAKAQLEFKEWAINVDYHYPLLGTSVTFGDPNTLSGFGLAWMMVFDMVTIGFDFKI